MADVRGSRRLLLICSARFSRRASSDQPKCSSKSSRCADFGFRTRANQVVDSSRNGGSHWIDYILSAACGRSLRATRVQRGALTCPQTARLDRTSAATRRGPPTNPNRDAATSCRQTIARIASSTKIV